MKKSVLNKLSEKRMSDRWGLNGRHVGAEGSKTNLVHAGDGYRDGESTSDGGETLGVLKT